MPHLARRILYSLFLLIGVSLLTFVLVDLAPGEFFDEMRLDPRVSAATVAGLRSQYGLDQPLPLKYLHWLRSIARGEGGFSFAYNSPAAPIVWARARNTLLLTGTATLLAWLIALPFGIWSAAKPGRVTNLLAGGTISTLLAIPDVILALLLLLLAVRSRYFPHFLLPTLCLTAGFLPLLLSHVRAAMTEVLQSPFIVAAHAHGIPLRRLLLRHALPAAANPLVSLFGFSLGILLSSSVVVEGIFGWPGLGQLLIEAILERDFYLVVDATVLATVFLILGNLLADTLLYAIDPRIRAEYR